MKPAFESIAKHFQPRLDEISRRVGKLEEALAKGGLLGEYRDILRVDLLAITNGLGHKSDRIPDRELFAVAMTEWSLSRTLSLPEKLASLETRGRWVAEQFLSEIFDEFRDRLKDAPKGRNLKLPGFLDDLEGDPRLREWACELTKGLYQIFSWIIRLDGVVQPEEAEGFKLFWGQFSSFQSGAGLASAPSKEIVPGDRGIPVAASVADRPLRRLVPEAWGMKPDRPTSTVAAIDRPATATPAEKPEFVLPSAVLPESSPEVDLAEALAELEELTGLGSVKEEVKSLANLLRMQELRKRRGLPAIPVSLHTVFTGNPGTGKTSVARIYARILRGLGLISKGHLVETDRSGLVAGYMGQTAEKVDAVVQRALDGILFIDEAYSLAGDEASDYGHEAISTLLSRMENHRDRLVVVVAGYGEEMDRFLDANPGLRSRFPRKWDFPDYSAIEMTEIFERLCARHKLALEEPARDAVTRLAGRTLEAKDPQMGNARFVRNLFESAISNQADRLAHVADPTDAELQTLTASDIS